MKIVCPECGHNEMKFDIGCLIDNAFDYEKATVTVNARCISCEKLLELIFSLKEIKITGSD